MSDALKYGSKLEQTVNYSLFLEVFRRYSYTNNGYRIKLHQAWDIDDG